jgi:hypothetical protein
MKGWLSGDQSGLYKGWMSADQTGLLSYKVDFTRVYWKENKLVFYHTKCSKYKVWLSGDESALLSHKSGLLQYSLNLHWVHLLQRRGTIG